MLPIESAVIKLKDNLHRCEAYGFTPAEFLSLIAAGELLINMNRALEVGAGIKVEQ